MVGGLRFNFIFNFFFSSFFLKYSQVGKINCPLLLINGTDDQNWPAVECSEEVSLDTHYANILSGIKELNGICLWPLTLRSPKWWRWRVRGTFWPSWITLKLVTWSSHPTRLTSGSPISGKMVCLMSYNVITPFSCFSFKVTVHLWGISGILQPYLLTCDQR